MTKEIAVPRVVSFIVLLAILLLMGAMFFQVMAKFVVPLFLAAVLVVMFRPLHHWFHQRLPRYPRISALATTLTILLFALLPTAYLGWNAYRECRGVIAYLKEPANRLALEEKLMERGATITTYVNEMTGLDVDINTVLDSAQSRVAAFLLNSVQTLGWSLIGFAIMILALYYFFLDGPNMIAGIMKMSPLDDEYERELLDKFASVSRAVVVASVASAVAQGLLAGAGFYFALNDGAPIFLLTMVTMVLAIVPFVGAAAVWVPTVLWIYFFQPTEVNGALVEGDAISAIALAIYGLCVISAVDNLIKPLVLHGQSNLHPLLALLSILGGVQVLGPIGILVGPMLVAFFQALLNMVNKELYRMGDGTLIGKHGARMAVPQDVAMALQPAPAGAGVPSTSPVHADPGPASSVQRRTKKRRK